MKYYFPYPSDKPEKKYYIVTKDNKRVYFGAAGMSGFTIHKDEERKQRDIKRHEKMNLNSGINPVLILLHSGLYIYYGINQPLKKVIKILKENF
jgi:hypothetical protein